MNNLKPMICPCCNAPLHSHVCEYCGVEFEGYEKKSLYKEQERNKRRRKPKPTLSEMMDELEQWEC